MKIALVLAPNLFKRGPLIGLAYLDAYLKAHDFEVDIFDLNTEIQVPHEGNETLWGQKAFVDDLISTNQGAWDLLARKVLRPGAEVIGFSAWASTSFASLGLARIMKREDPKRMVVFGGPQCSFFPDELLSDGSVDALVFGEGEATFLELARQYRAQGRVEACPGAATRRDGAATPATFRPEIPDLDALPFPDFSGFPLKKYYFPNHLPITFYRGCARRCVFCNSASIWKKFRARSARNIFREMLHQKNLYPNLEKFEVDDTALNLDLNVISELCDLMSAHDFKIRWGGAAIIHPDLGPELLRKMGRAGCNSLAYGLESGSQVVVDGMRKGFRIDAAERVIRDTHDAGIGVDLNVVVGFPGETEREFQETCAFIQRNREFISFVSFPSECWVGNDTYLHTHPEDFGIVLGESGHLWRSRDGTNTHEVRQDRLSRFNGMVSSLGLSQHNYATEAAKRQGAARL